MKQRLVGTLVLGSLALILIPLLLDGEGVERPPLSGSIPPAPVFDNTPLPEPERPEILADTLAPADGTAAAEDVAPDLADASIDTTSTDTTSTDATSPETATPAAEEPAPEAEAAPLVTATAVPEPPPAAAPAPQSTSAPAIDTTGLPEGWAVRLGVFGARANADRLLSRLVADGYKAYARPLGVSTAVLVGPVLTQNEAVALQTELDGLKAKYQIDNAIVQRYDIGQ